LRERGRPANVFEDPDNIAPRKLNLGSMPANSARGCRRQHNFRRCGGNAFCHAALLVGRSIDLQRTASTSNPSSPSRSSDKSVTIFFSLPFSFSSRRSRYISDDIRPPYFLRVGDWSCRIRGSGRL
jgi:hypothetical protein